MEWQKDLLFHTSGIVTTPFSVSFALAFKSCVNEFLTNMWFSKSLPKKISLQNERQIYELLKQCGYEDQFVDLTGILTSSFSSSGVTHKEMAMHENLIRPPLLSADRVHDRKPPAFRLTPPLTRDSTRKSRTTRLRAPRRVTSVVRTVRSLFPLNNL